VVSTAIWTTRLWSTLGRSEKQRGAVLEKQRVDMEAIVDRGESAGLLLVIGQAAHPILHVPASSCLTTFFTGAKSRSK